MPTGCELVSRPPALKLADPLLLSYLWSFAYFSSHHRSILITLKASLRKIPVIGWATRLYGFIFLARDWTADKVPFANQLKKVTRNLKRGGEEEKLVS